MALDPLFHPITHKKITGFPLGPIGDVFFRKILRILKKIVLLDESTPVNTSPLVFTIFCFCGFLYGPASLSP